MTALIRIDRSWTAADRAGARAIRFCSRCGHFEEEPPGCPDPKRRVCRRCGMGLMLACARDALPGEAAAFVIVTYELGVGAVSEPGEKVFGREEALLGMPLLELMRSPLGDDLLVRNVAQASQRACEPIVMPVRLCSERARRVGTLAARVATCGPPRAALVTVEPSEFGRR